MKNIAVTYQKEHRLAYFMYWIGTSDQIKAKNSSHLSAAAGEDEEPQGWMNWLNSCAANRAGTVLCNALLCICPCTWRQNVRAMCGAVCALLFTPHRHRTVILPFGFSAAWRNKWILSDSNGVVTLSSIENFLSWNNLGSPMFSPMFCAFFFPTTQSSVLPWRCKLPRVTYFKFQEKEIKDWELEWKTD